MNDKYSHMDMEVVYITESIPGPAESTPEYEILHGNYNSQMLENCLCSNMCVTMMCKCLQVSHGDNYDRYIEYNGNFKYKLNYKSSMFKDYPIIECNSNCLCPANCGNRIVQNGPMEGLIVKACDDQCKGLGLFAPDFILKGTFICEYAGELLTKSQAIQRIKQNEAQGKINYIFCLNEHTYEGVIQTFVDPSKFGNIGRYINHSCEPNCLVVPVRAEIVIPRLAIFACTDIQPGEEITFSYSSGSKDSSDKTVKKKCQCHSSSCNGFLPCENL